MSQITAVFDIPAPISAGLANGSLERIGGVIRNSESKQIVAWLRDGIVPKDTQNTISKLLFSQGLLLTNPALAPMFLLNLTIQTVGFIKLNQRLKKIETDLTGLKKEFERDRLVRRQSALNAARDVLETNDPAFMMVRMNEAIKGLYEAQDQLLLEIEGTSALHKKVELITQALELLILRAHCYLRSGQEGLALKELSGLNELKKAARKTVELCLGPHPAIFLHPTFGNEVAHSFIKLQIWLKDQDFPTPETFISIINSLRPDFWNDKATATLQKQSDTKNLIRRLTKHESNKENLLGKLSLATIICENFDRVEGFQIEVRALKLMDQTWQEWEGKGKHSDHRYYQQVLINQDEFKKLKTA